MTSKNVQANGRLTLLLPVRNSIGSWETVFSQQHNVWSTIQPIQLVPVSSQAAQALKFSDETCTAAEQLKKNRPPPSSLPYILEKGVDLL